jgi:general secretion pathway protein M
MNEWWQNLALREKRMLAAGAILVLLFLFYEIIWSPFSGKIKNMRQQVQHNQELLSWMKNADQRIKAVEKNSAHSTTQMTGSLLSVIQQEVNKNFAHHVTQLRQAENDSVQLDLQKVDFDRLISLLTELSNKYGLIVTQITTTSTGVPGEVVASMVIRSP